MRTFRRGMLIAACALTVAVVGVLVVVQQQDSGTRTDPWFQPVASAARMAYRNDVRVSARGPADLSRSDSVGRAQQAASAKARETITRAARERARALRVEAHRIARTEARRSAPITFRIGSMNVLGSQHTGPGTRMSKWAPGRLRAQWEATVIRQQGADVVGFSEMQRNQLSTLMSMLPNFDFYPKTSLGNPGVPTNVAWNTDRFELVRAHYITITFLGQRRPMPIVLLQDKATGRKLYVFNAHNSPNRNAKHTYQKERNRQVAAEVAEINRLRDKYPRRAVFLTGDLNSHDEVFCKVTGQTDLTAAAGGSHSGSCRPPRPIRVDWIFGSNTTWSNFTFDRSLLVRRATDHAVPFATATIS